ncbi:MAG TPA: conjugal transfer protein TrbE [Phenylobacterium sp.]|uniref:conjugal transfer protein TrbE n=1 Tax=Phenylobacterium sp. TaxID=1871053 RepID=UPI002F95F001
MRFLDEFRRRPISLADHLPWAVLVAPGVVLNKDGSFLTALRFRGPDLESSTEDELMAVRARLNNGLRRLGAGWCLHVEAARRPADPYIAMENRGLAAWLVDAERQALFEDAEPAFETDFTMAFTWLPPADETRWLERAMFSGLGKAGREWRTALAAFRHEIEVAVDLLSQALPEVRLLSDEELLTWLRACVSGRASRVKPDFVPAFLDSALADEPLAGGLEPKLGDRWLKVVSIRALPAATRPGLLDALSTLPFELRWSARWIGLDKAEAEREITRLRKRWFAKRKGLSVLLREAVTKEEVPLFDTDAAVKVDECDGVLAALGSEVCAYGYFTLTVTILDGDRARAAEKARAAVAALNAQGLVARVEDVNAVEAWLGSIPGEPYADVRRPMISTLNLADLLPVSAVWAGPARDACLDGAPLVVARTTGATPFRLALHVGDVGHAMVVGPTGSGKSALLSFLALQWFRYPRSRVIFLDKGRSARAATLAAGGVWRSLEPGDSFSLQPLAEIEAPSERAWAAEWIAEAVRAAGVEPDPGAREEIWASLNAMAEAPRGQRTLTVFCAMVQDRAVATALEPLTLQGAHGHLMDGAGDELVESCFDTFELESVMAARSASVPMLNALFHRLERGFDGRPTLLILDEAWLFLDDTVFAAKIREWLKTLRKKRVAVIFATQSLEDVAASPIAASLIESCPTQVFLPNPRALEPGGAQHYRAFGLNQRQLELLALATPKRSYYWRQPGGRRLFDLKLSGLSLALCAASSPEDQLLIDAALSQAGQAGFARAFLKAKGVPHVDQLFDAFDAPEAAA